MRTTTPTFSLMLLCSQILVAGIAVAADRDANASGWDRYFSGQVLASTASDFNNATSRTSTYLRLLFNREGSRVDTVVEARFYTNEAEFTYEGDFTYVPVSNTSGLNPYIQTHEFTRKISADDAELRQAYVNFRLGEHVQLSLGRKVIAWGQFDVFSPVDWILPLDYSNTNAILSNTELRAPQDIAQLSFFPAANVEIHLYHFNSIPKQLLEDELFPTTSYVTLDCPVGTTVETGCDLVSAVQTSYRPQDDSQSALRFVWYGERATWGITYYDGFFPYLTSTYAYRPVANWPVSGESVYYAEPTTTYTKSSAVGIEFSAPIGKYLFKVEYLSLQDFPVLLSQQVPICFTIEDNTATTPIEDFCRAVLIENGGQGHVPENLDILAFGLEYASDRWDWTLALFAINEPDSELANRTDSHLEADSRLSVSSRPSGWVVVPALSVARHWNPSSQLKVTGGLLLGRITGAGGLSLYTNFGLREKLNILLSLEYIQYDGDGFYAAQVANECESAAGLDLNATTVRAGMSPCAGIPATPAGYRIDFAEVDPITRGTGLRVGFAYSF